LCCIQRLSWFCIPQAKGAYKKKLVQIIKDDYYRRNPNAITEAADREALAIFQDLISADVMNSSVSTDIEPNQPPDVQGSMPIAHSGECSCSECETGHRPSTVAVIMPNGVTLNVKVPAGLLPGQQVEVDFCKQIGVIAESHVGRQPISIPKLAAPGSGNTANVVAVHSKAVEGTAVVL
jgi:hypothetical protein